MKVLKPFQVEDGIAISKRRSALVAHMPRVGKSGVSIHASDLVQAKLVVVVCPASVIENWRRAIDDFRTGGWTAFIVSYNKLAEFLPRLRTALRQRNLLLDVVVIDESHYAKNWESARTKHVYGSTCDGAGGLVELAERVYCLTGTPMPNDPTELWPMLRAIAPNIIAGANGKPMTQTQFKMRYCKMVQTGLGMKIVGSKNYTDLKQRMRGFVLRRTRKEVFGRDLPAPQKVYVKPGREYKAELQALQESEQGRKVARALEMGGLKALIREEKNVAGLRRMFGLAKVPPIVSLIAEELDIEPDKKQVLFCFHTAVIDALASGLRKYGVLVYDGRTSQERKIRIQDSFRDNPKHRIVIGQIAAMGLGLDFSASSDCMMVEQDWVGDANEQAAARIFNMNDPEPKFVRWAILSGSFDEQIVAACDRKLAASRKIFS